VGDELEQVLAVDGGVTEALPFPEPVRIEATAADLYYRAVLAIQCERVHPDLPGHRSRMVEDVVEAVRQHVQAGVGGAGIG
jgi:hypothetical protein